MKDVVPCGVCGRGFPKGKCHIITLSEEEKQVLRDSNQEVLEEYIYCQPCWRTLSNPVSGPAVMKGLLQIRLQQSGVSNAEQVATKFHAKLVSKIQKPRA